MNLLTKSKCETCDSDVKPLSVEEIKSLLLEVDGWVLIIDANIQKLKREFVTKNYSRSMALTTSIATLAENENHHPLIIVEYGTVTVMWWTHQIKGLHKNDFIMAAKTSVLFDELHFS